jgi:hypothetical protein
MKNNHDTGADSGLKATTRGFLPFFYAERTDERGGIIL